MNASVVVFGQFSKAAKGKILKVIQTRRVLSLPGSHGPDRVSGQCKAWEITGEGLQFSSRAAENKK